MAITWKKVAFVDDIISDIAYNATSWDAVTNIAPSKNAVRDEIELRAPKASPIFTGIITTAGQIAFPATVNASANVNTLDDYEEGSWTFGLTFGGNAVGMTTSYNAGRYLKIGNMVIITGAIILTNKGTSTGVAVITGLPFTSRSTYDGFSTVNVRLSGITFGGQNQAYVNVNTTTMPLTELSEAGVITAITDTDFANDSTIIVSVTYEIG